MKKKYRDYTSAKKFVKKLNLKSINEWTNYCKSGNKPDDIPIHVDGYYQGKGWISWGDFLGTGYIALSKRKYKSFKEAREYAKKLGLKSYGDWRIYCKSGNKPNDIPISADRFYKDKGWISWGDFLGTGIVSVNKVEFLTFEECREYIRKLKFKSKRDWDVYYSSGQKPNFIPSNPSKKYKDDGWKGWPDFLGTDTIAPQNIVYPTYEECKELAISLNLKSLYEWKAYCKKHKTFKDTNLSLPLGADIIYKNKGWESWPKFLGTYKNIEYRNFEQAKEYVIGLGLKITKEFEDLYNSGQIPIDIPKYPNDFYKKSGWKDWGDFLGNGKISHKDRVYKTYDEAREYIKNLNLKSFLEWREYSKSGLRPIDIPSNPFSIYKNEWVSWSHFLGYLGDGSIWKRKSLIHYLEEMKEYLNLCSIYQLFTIITSNGLNRYIKNSDLKKLELTSPNTKERELAIEEIIANVSPTSDELEIKDSIKLDDEITDSTIDVVLNSSDACDVDKKEKNIIINQIKSIDNNPVITKGLDEERINFLINDFINNLWYDFLNDKVDIKLLSEVKLKDTIPSKIKQDFLKEFKSVNNLKLPKNWIYPHEPLLMQKLIAYRLKQKKCYGNWSGVGSGKTISAILAGQYVGAKNVLVITFNSTIGNEDQRGWMKEIRDSVKDAKIYSKPEKNVKFNNKESNYLVLNYESFQQSNSEHYVKELLERNKFDYIILDEVQNIKQISKSEESKRRRIILNLIEIVSKKNPDYYLLAMSATPIINNLSEARSLVELILSKQLDDISVVPTINNCMRIFQKLTNCGIRYKNTSDNFLKSNSYTLLEVNGNHLSKTAKHIKRENYLLIDRLLLETKLKAILPYINSSKGKTIIYTYYVDKIDDYVYDYLTKLGYKVGVYTGSQSKISREECLNEFIDGDYDILLGSKPIGTGVDGLQKVADTLIILSLPWTNAELVQLVGRINRKGSAFQKTGINVIIPIVSIEDNGIEYKWDHKRYNAITYKKTIANAAVDGIIPDKIIKSKEPIIERAKSALPKWIKRLKEESSEVQ